MFELKHGWLRVGGICVVAMAGMAAAASCGGDKSSPTSDSGGAAPTAGTGTGGKAAGGAGGASTGGAPLVPFKCPETPAPGPSIAPGTSGVWGSASDVAGGTFKYVDSTASNALTADTATTPGSVIVTATLAASGYNGYGLYFKDPDKCWSAAAYQGIRFTVSGSTGGATMLFQVQTNNNYPIDNTNSKGACQGTWSSGCGNNQAPAITVTATATPVEIKFTDLTGGQPDAMDPKEILGIQWQWNCTTPPTGTTSCPINVTLGTVEFY
jgi:hypothetical protein